MNSVPLPNPEPRPPNDQPAIPRPPSTQASNLNTSLPNNASTRPKILITLKKNDSETWSPTPSQSQTSSDVQVAPAPAAGFQVAAERGVFRL